MVIQDLGKERFQFYSLFTLQSSDFMSTCVWSCISVELLFRGFWIHTSEYWQDTGVCSVLILQVCART